MKYSTPKLQKAISSIYNHLYANSEKKTPRGIAEEVGKILHTGMYLEENTLYKPAFRYTKTEEKKAAQKGNDSISAFVRNYFVQMNKNWALYPDDATINIKNFDIVYTCLQLNGIELSDRNRDVFGDALEIFRSQWAKQVGGQFFTDSLVTHLAIELIEFNPKKGDDLVDICAGTGGFLIAGMNKINNQFKKRNKQTESHISNIVREKIIGQEYDKEVCGIANATIATRIGDSKFNFVSQGDSLDNLIFNDVKSRIQFDAHSCVVGNPPFGTKITIKDIDILKNFELAKVKARQNDLTKSKVTHRAPDILFLEQNIKLLKPGKGRMSLVVPYQILSGPQALYIRNWLLLNTEILSVIDLPSDTFQPHTGTKGCLLTLKRRKEPLKDINKTKPYKIFMSTPRWIGHDRRGNPMYKKNIEGTDTDEILTDFNELEEAYRKFKTGKEFITTHKESFEISIHEVLNEDLLQLNAQFHKPILKKKISLKDKNWKTVKLKQVVEKVFYPGRFVRNYVDHYPGAVPFFGGKEIIQMVVESNKWLGHNHPKLKDLQVKKGWILITRSGTTGIVSIVPEAWDGIAMSEHVIRVIPNTEKINPYFLLTFLKTEYCQSLISKGVYGSVIDSITPDFIENINVHIPSDKSKYNQISKITETAEKMRNESLMNMYEGIKELNEKLLA